MLHASQDKTIWNFNKYINYWAEVQVKKNLTNVDAVKTSQRKKKCIFSNVHHENEPAQDGR